MTDEPGKDVAQQTEAGPPTPAAPAKKPLLPPSRIVFLIFVAVAAVVIVMELCAKWPYENSVAAIEERMPEKQDEEEAQKDPGVYRQDGLDELLSGSPSRDLSQDKRSETIAWNGVLKSYRLKLRYTDSGLLLSYKTEVVWSWED